MRKRLRYLVVSDGAVFTLGDLAACGGAAALPRRGPCRRAWRLRAFTARPLSPDPDPVPQRSANSKYMEHPTTNE